MDGFSSLFPSGPLLDCNPSSTWPLFSPPLIRALCDLQEMDSLLMALIDLPFPFLSRNLYFLMAVRSFLPCTVSCFSMAAPSSFFFFAPPWAGLFDNLCVKPTFLFFHPFYLAPAGLFPLSLPFRTSFSLGFETPSSVGSNDRISIRFLSGRVVSQALFLLRSDGERSIHPLQSYSMTGEFFLPRPDPPLFRRIIFPPLCLGQ